MKTLSPPLPRVSALASCLRIGVSLCSGFTSLQLTAASLGLFEGQDDIGVTQHAGSATYAPAEGTYLVAGGGANMWSDTDAFHFVWKRLSGDVSLTANISFVGEGGNAHRKACLLVRQGLEPDAAYADAVLHGDGLTSLQYREAQGARTYEIQANITGPKRLRIEKRGEYVSMSYAGKDDVLRPAGGSFRLTLQDPFYVGLGVCAHDNEVIERAVFSRVVLSSSSRRDEAGVIRRSTLEIVPIASKDRRVVYTTTDPIAAPNWSPDGASLIYNSGGSLYRIPAAGGKPKRINTAFAKRINSDHGLSPDGAQLAISDSSRTPGQSLVYVLPFGGGTPRRITDLGPSYWHGWSPDGTTLAYTGKRDGEYDLYTVPAAGGAETRLTTTPGLDDGPAYSPDGRWIYFNSERTGSMQIWRMRADGTQAEPVTSDAFNNAFPHPSPDGRWLVFLSYAKHVQGYPTDQDVTVRILPLGGGEIQVLAKLLGGQGTMNAPCWSPDSASIAFVSYQYTR